jgi:hypothetical protein
MQPPRRNALLPGKARDSQAAGLVTSNQFENLLRRILFMTIKLSFHPPILTAAGHLHEARPVYRLQLVLCEGIGRARLL